MPKGYGFLAKGIRYKTLHCRKLTHEAKKILYIVVDKKKQVGLRVPLSILHQVHAQAKQTLPTRRAATEKRDAADIGKAAAELHSQFPKIPEKDKEKVLKHGFKKHSGRVGRTSSIPLSRKVLLAVIAHVRHQHTTYDTLLSGGEDRDMARKKTRKQIETIMREWGFKEALNKPIHENITFTETALACPPTPSLHYKRLAMSNNQIKNIAIVGASGNIGSQIATALLAKGQFNITAISRAESKGTFPQGIKIAHIDYNNPDTIVKALKGQEVLIITMGVLAAPDTQTKLIRAAAEAGVPWVLPNEYGMYTSEEVQNELIGPGKAKDRQLIEELGVSSWIGVVCGFWYAHSLSGPGLYGFDIAKREAVFFDEGTEKLNTSTFPQVGRTVAALLSLPVSSQGSTEGGPTLSDYRNSRVYTSSFALNQLQFRRKNAMLKPGEQLKGGNRMAFGKVLYTRYFFPGDYAGLYEKIHGLDNEKLGLPQEDLDEATAEVEARGERLLETIRKTLRA
ncbi:hypothetical protein N0V83_000303 [Neocucurbitaria cava]|uniref:NAD(P)-binding domain-containing protein n=1 Tax=Neocucurbitaria cava TaxID=798079 RepID=A0A9W8YH88_9PLEO|nr:hypothetical protein N0V83_000303 [Neocucurbitaria cava]